MKSDMQGRERREHSALSDRNQISPNQSSQRAPKLYREHSRRASDLESDGSASRSHSSLQRSFRHHERSTGSPRTRLEALKPRLDRSPQHGSPLRSQSPNRLRERRFGYDSPREQRSSHRLQAEGLPSTSRSLLNRSRERNVRDSKRLSPQRGTRADCSHPKQASNLGTPDSLKASSLAVERGSSKAEPAPEHQMHSATSESTGAPDRTTAAKGALTRPSNPKLDFFSMEFDAKLALHAEGLQPPYRVRPLDTLAKCRHILPPEMEESLNYSNFVHKSQEEMEQSRARVGPVRLRREAEELKYSVISRIAESVKRGPLLLLRQSYDSGKRVRVVTRHARGVRGTATGVLKAFDKHMNLVLQDVQESYTVRLKIQRRKLVPRQVARDASLEGMDPSEGGPDYELVEQSRSAFKLDHRHRNLRQIFVRGNNIVMVSQAEAAVPPSLADTAAPLGS